MKKLAVLFILLLLSQYGFSDEEGGFCVACQNGGSAADPTKPLAEIKDKVDSSLDDTYFLDPETVEKTDSRTLAKMILQRLHDICDPLRDPTLTKMDTNNSEIVMLVSDKYLTDIANNGFKNQHETGSTGGCNCKENRIDAETSHVFMSVPYSSKTRELLPKYALQVFKDTKLGAYGLPLQYGNVMVRFKSDVSKRATWSAQDSLGIKDVLRTHDIRPPKDKKCMGYCEAQIWGALDFTDVDSIVLPEGVPITDDMKKLGVPIYTYKYDSVTGDRIRMCSMYPSYCPDGSDAQKVLKSAKNSLAGVEISKSAVYTPDASATPQKPVDMSLSEIKSAYDSETNPAKKNFLESNRLRKTSTKDLIQEYKDILKKENGYAGGVYGGTLGTKKTRLLAEIAGREKTSDSKALLKQELEKKPYDNNLKGIALGGLAASGNWKDVKPYVLSVLNDPTASAGGYYGEAIAYKTAAYIAASHLDDADITQALSTNGVGTNLMNKIKNKQFCQKEDYE